MRTNLYILLTCLLGFSFNAMAEGSYKLTWTGDGDGWRWEDAANWDLNQVPTEYDSVMIDGSAYVQVTDTDYDAHAMYINLSDEATLFLNEGTTLYVGYSYGSAMEMYDDSALVIWGELNLGYTGMGEPQDEGAPNGLTMEDDSKAFNRGALYVSYTGDSGDGIDIEDRTSFINRGMIYMSYIDQEGIDMDNDAFFRNRGTIEMMELEDSDGIDVDDDDTRFENDGTISIGYVYDGGEGIEVDDGIFINGPSGIINLGFISGDLVQIEDDGTFENYGVLNLDVDLFGPSLPETPGSPAPDEEEPVTADDPEFSILGAISVEGDGTFINHEEINIEPLFLGTPAGTPSTAEEIYYYFYASLELTSSSSTFENKDCGVINIEGPFPIWNAGELYNEGTINLDQILIPISPEEIPGPPIPGNFNDGYFENDGDILSEGPFIIGPAPVYNVWDEASIGGGAETNNFSLGCDVQITTSSRQGRKATSDNVAYLNQTLCGNSMITTRIDGVSNGFGGIMIRDMGQVPQAPGQPSSNGQKAFFVASNLTDVVRHSTRYNEGDALSFTPFYTPHDNWLRVERVGNYIRAYHSSDGNFWSQFHQVYLELGECAQVGLFATSRNGNPAMVAFSHVEISGSSYEPLVMPNVPTAQTPDMQQAAKVWPTPVQSQFTVEFEQATATAGTAILRNELGQAIGQRKLEPGTLQLEWDANTLPGGLYLLEVQTVDGFREVLKVIKQ